MLYYSIKITNFYAPDLNQDPFVIKPTFVYSPLSFLSMVLLYVKKSGNRNSNNNLF